MERLQGVEGRGCSRVHRIATSAKGTRLRTSGRSAVTSRLRGRTRRRRWMICVPFASPCEQVPNQQRDTHGKRACAPDYPRGEANDNVEMTDRDKQTRDFGPAAVVGRGLRLGPRQCLWCSGPMYVNRGRPATPLAELIPSRAPRCRRARAGRPPFPAIGGVCCSSVTVICVARTG